MVNALSRWWVWVVLLAWGCTVEEASEVDPETPDTGRVVTDGSLSPDMGLEADAGEVLPDAMMRIDGAIDVDAEPSDASPPDMMMASDAFVPVEIDSCEEACGRFEDCERIARDWGSLEACLTACERSSSSGAPEVWFECLGAEACGTLRFCPLPEPPALTCAEVCEAAEGCGLADPIGTCVATCEGWEADGQSAFSACGESLVGVCQEEAFWGCLGESVYQECGTRCQAAVECGIEDRATCVPECIAQINAVDPLARLRGEQRNSCVRIAGDACGAVAECFEVPEPGDPPPVADCRAFCDVIGQCQPIFEDCLLECGLILEEDPIFFEPILECTVSQVLVNGQCDFNALERCFEGGGGGNGGAAAQCPALCEAQSVCGLLPEDVNLAQCNQQCVDTLRLGGDPALAQTEALACRFAQTCGALTGCLDGVSPEAICGEWCGALDGCGLPPAAGNAEGCIEACVEGFAPQRQQQWRACVAEAGDDCDAMAACTPPEPPACDVYCDRRLECGFERDVESCALRCDDNHLVDAAFVVEQVACTGAAPVCESALGSTFSVFECENEVGRGAAPEMTPCYQYCRATTECDPEADRTLEACMRSCGRALPPEDALRLQSGECLANLPPTATCDVLRACVDPLEAEVSCGAYCEAAVGCGVADEGCAAACVEGVLPAEAACVAESVRLEQGCGAVAACTGFEGEQPSADCQALCQGQLACDPQLDVFLCERQCTPDPAPLDVQLACIEVAGCRGIQACLALDEVIPEACVTACETAAPCPAPWGADGDCQVDCAGLAGSPSSPPEFLQALPACVGAAVNNGVCDAGAVAACFDPVPTCQEICGLVEECGIFPPGFCQEILCPGGELDPADPVAQCAIETAELGICDINLFFECLEVP
ncbi:MAG: hypothetical protein ACE366_07650 [Bradymonadia bacterium]